MILFHGTPTDFPENSFTLSPRCYDEGVGVYFTPDIQTASTYGKFIFSIDLPEQPRYLSSAHKTITVEEFEDIALKLNDTHDYLSNWGEIELEGLTDVLDSAIQHEYLSADSDAELLSALGAACGDHAGVTSIVSQLLDVKVMRSFADENKFSQDLYIILDMDYLNALTQTKTLKPMPSNSLSYIEELEKE